MTWDVAFATHGNTLDVHRARFLCFFVPRSRCHLAQWDNVRVVLVSWNNGLGDKQSALFTLAGGAALAALAVAALAIAPSTIFTQKTLLNAIICHKAQASEQAYSQQEKFHHLHHFHTTVSRVWCLGSTLLGEWMKEEFCQIKFFIQLTKIQGTPETLATNIQ